jgi:hypothetical protein
MRNSLSIRNENRHRFEINSRPGNPLFPLPQSKRFVQLIRTKAVIIYDQQLQYFFDLVEEVVLSLTIHEEEKMIHVLL